MAEKVKVIAQEDAHVAGTQVVYAEAKLGELLREIPDKKASSGGGTCSLPPNITKKLSHEAQTISNNPEIVVACVGVL
jgi:hypothetical protein